MELPKQQAGAVWVGTQAMLVKATQAYPCLQGSHICSHSGPYKPLPTLHATQNADKAGGGEGRNVDFSPKI